MHPAPQPNPKLQEAAAIFKALGWEGVNAENILQLPLGTAEQKRTALDGLKSGEWGEFVETNKNTWSWRNYVDVNTGNLSLFAIRIGLDARKAAGLVQRMDGEMLAAVVADRGVKYATEFIRYACTSRRRGTEHGPTAFGNAIVRVVDRLGMDVPQSVDYMKDWSAYAAWAMGLNKPRVFDAENLPGPDIIERRFAEHVAAGAAVNAPATGPFGKVLPAGAKRGWISRDKAVELVFLSLDASVRPGDRKAWLDALDELGVTDEELCARTQELVPLLASGDTAVVTRLAPTLISKADAGTLAEVVAAALSADAKKARVAVLRSALDRPCPEGCEGLTPMLSAMAGGTDRETASLSTRLMERWSMSAEPLPDEGAAVQGLWQEPPPLWRVPPFDMGEASPESLTDLAAELVKRPEQVHDVTAERFLAVANAVAFKDPEAARTSLRGLREVGRSMVGFATSWVNGEDPRFGADEKRKSGVEDVFTARDYVVFIHLGKLPCLLSTPSSDDLSVSVPDLAARLSLYKQTGTDALEADLYLALTRLDAGTSTPEAAEALRGLDIPVVMQSGKRMPVAAGPAALAYLADPVKEQALRINKDRHWGPSDNAIVATDALRGFPERLYRYHPELFSLFPRWGDSAMEDVVWNDEVYHSKGLIMRQVARRASPLPPGASINFLAAMRSSTPHAAEDSALAVTEAWARGLLRPGVADVAYLDWSAQPPSNLAALASALDGIARDGLLAVVWPVLDALVAASLKETRLLSGTADIVELTASLLPEAQAAVERGAADPSALSLPGVRALARQGGSSKAVTAARRIAGALPPEQDAPEKAAAAAPAMDPPFEAVWPADKKDVRLIEDGVKVRVEYSDAGPKPRLLFIFALPDVPDRIFHQAVNTSPFYLREKARCMAYAADPSSVVFAHDKKDRVWLSWDAERGAMVVSDTFDEPGVKDGLFDTKKSDVPPWSISFLTMAVGLLAQDGDAVYFAPRMLWELVHKGMVDDRGVRAAMLTLLQSPAVSPAKLMRPLEKDVRLLHVLWPMLTESIKAAGAETAADGGPPPWANRVLDTAVRYAPYLAEAARRGLIPAEDARWAGLSDIASSKSKSTAIGKSKELQALLG